MIGLERSDINFNTGMVSITKTLQRIGKELVNGNPIHLDTPRKIFEMILKKNNLPIINFHSLRHTSASLQIPRGISVANI
ncbi:MAG: hypothetical protein PHY08_10770, partial [Candidatus Cloacimonetes bacterium]|nr:hypothetical protein [Candidatus Cloacimonadota bacterium]